MYFPLPFSPVFKAAPGMGIWEVFTAALLNEDAGGPMSLGKGKKGNFDETNPIFFNFERKC